MILPNPIVYICPAYTPQGNIQQSISNRTWMEYQSLWGNKVCCFDIRPMSSPSFMTHSYGNIWSSLYLFVWYIFTLNMAFVLHGLIMNSFITLLPHVELASSAYLCAKILLWGCDFQYSIHYNWIGCWIFLLWFCKQCIFKVKEKQSGLWKFLNIFWSIGSYCFPTSRAASFSYCCQSPQDKRLV